MNQDVSKKIATFFGQFKKQEFRKGEILIRVDDDPAGIYYITDGIVKKYAISNKGEEITVNIFKPFAFFPMSWAVNLSPNHYFYEAVTPVTVWRAPREDVVTFVKENPDVLYDLIQRVYRGTDGLTQRLFYLMSGSAYTRLITELLIHSKRFGIIDTKTGATRVAISEKDLASQAGMTRETVSREMKKLKDTNLLTFVNGQLVIANLEDLEKELSNVD